MVRTSIFGWRTFPDLCLMYGLQVTSLWVNCPSAMGQPTWPTQASVPRGRKMSSNACNYMDYGVETIKRQTRVACGCMAASQKSVGAGLDCGLGCSPALSDTLAVGGLWRYVSAMA